MRALVLEGAGVLTVRDVDEPPVSPGETLVSVEVAGLGGSEALALTSPGIRPLPNIMGHGIAGMAPDGRRVAIYPLIGCGLCRYCQRSSPQLCADWTLIGVQRDGGLAERVVVPDDALVELPNELT